ncbi:hypothetical protein REC12_05355 [Desulfosporosinus sp. PR]|nr:hypothetical protein [Desulfosporosinus sp. PR]
MADLIQSQVVQTISPIMAGAIAPAIILFVSFMAGKSFYMTKYKL